MADDIIRDCVRRVKEMHPDTSDEQLLGLELILRRSWGGERVYVLKASSLGKAHSLAESLAAGRSIREAAQEVGVHRSTGWRWLRRGWVAGF